jgi:hypothetical protein
MEYAVGIALALIVSTFARLTGFDRGRAFCLAFDVGAAAFLAWLLMARKVSANRSY